MKKVIPLLLSLFLIVPLFQNNENGFAKNNKINPLVKSVSSDSITLAWDPAGEYYEIFTLKGKKVWAGKETSYTIKNLKPKEVADYIILAYDHDNNVVDRLLC